MTSRPYMVADSPASPRAEYPLPASKRAPNNWNLPWKPTSGGSPSRLSRKKASATTIHGARRTNPRMSRRSSEPVMLRRKATTAKAPRFMNR